MILKGQGQTAGDNASQVQVAGDLVLVQGVTEERAHEIALEAAREVVSEYSHEAQAAATARINRFDTVLVERLMKSGLLGALCDPALQVTLRKAQIGAASTERDGDYEMLAALLEDRAKRADERPVRAGINRAVEVVDQLDDSALTALTVFLAVSQFLPKAFEVDKGLRVMDDLIRQLMSDQPLAVGTDWIDHLDVLGAVRADSLQSFRKFDDYWPNKTPGYVSVGVPNGFDETQEAKDALATLEVGLPLVPHELKPEFMRYPLPYATALDTEIMEAGHTAEEIEAFHSAVRDTFNVDTVDQDVIPAYMERVRALPHFGRVAEWWDMLPTHFVITPVGRVLARANAKRLDTMGLLPPLD